MLVVTHLISGDMTHQSKFIVQTKLSKKLNLAYGYEKGQIELKAVKEELGSIKKEYDHWNQLVGEAQQSGDSTRVQAALEGVGVKFSKAQKDDDDDIILDEGDKRLKALEEKYDKKLESLEGALYNKYTTDVHSQLEAKFNDGKHPEYNRKEIEDFANKKGIRDFEDAYLVMKHDELIKMQLEENKGNKKKHADKVSKVSSKEPDFLLKYEQQLIPLKN